MFRLSKRHTLLTGLALTAGYAALLTSFETPPTAANAPHAPPPSTASAPPLRVRGRAAPPPLAAAVRKPAAPGPDPQAGDKAEPELARPAEQPAPESQLADWMLAAIRGEEWDRARTEAVEAELNATLERAPDLHAQDLECGKRFCRALLVERRGKPGQLQALIGAPPFDGEGFTTLGQGGKTEIFFTRAGESLAALRDEASL